MRGDLLRDDVARLIKTRYGNAIVEHKVGGKDADIFFTMPYPGGAPIKIAVECKSWARPLQSAQITNIFAQYGPAFRQRDIDSLWIVAPHPLRGEQRETVELHGLELRFFTVESLINEIIDFTSYMRFLVDDFTDEALNKYYIMPRAESGGDLHQDIVLPWLASDPARPLAIVAGYGAGKTSYAKFLARELAIAALRNPQAPKPILLSLGNLTRQQSIRGLINTLFSDEHNVEGYKHQLFQLLVERGLFVIIFDGFDEMKHAMRSRDIMTNFIGLREFMKGTESKYLVLGRPAPFMTLEDELPFRSRMKVGDQIIHDPMQTEFTIVGLDEFSSSEVIQFLTGFLQNATTSTAPLSQQYIEARIGELRGKDIQDIIKKPVHAKMVGILLASPTWKVDAATEYDLYHHFVGEFIKREVTQKDARSHIPETVRLAFMRRIAWFLFAKRGPLSFETDLVPESVLEGFKIYFEDGEDRNVILRELLTGSMLTRKMSADLVVEKDAYSFYFPHRSYWEFLVAEFIASEEFERSHFHELLSGIGPQIAKFLRERRDRKFVRSFLPLILGCDVPIELAQYVELCTAIRRPSEGSDLPTPFTLVVDGMATLGKQLSFADFKLRVENAIQSLDFTEPSDTGKNRRQITVLVRTILLTSMLYFCAECEPDERAEMKQFHINLYSQLMHVMVRLTHSDKVLEAIVQSNVWYAQERLPEEAIFYFSEIVSHPTQSMQGTIEFSLPKTLEALEKFLDISVGKEFVREPVLSSSIKRFAAELRSAAAAELREFLGRVVGTPKPDINQFIPPDPKTIGLNPDYGKLGDAS